MKGHRFLPEFSCLAKDSFASKYFRESPQPASRRHDLPATITQRKPYGHATFLTHDRDALRRAVVTRSVRACVPTQSVGTRRRL
jgi:hypothetical protein